MRLPRDLSGRQLAKLLQRFGYQIKRQEGSHMRLTSQQMGTSHHITIPDHNSLKVGTLNNVLSEVAAYLKRERDAFLAELFDRS
ncbi:MAG: hypothetical protein DMG67_07995 [Acidobacteria bacterium]|nr:MAG: hypothetical protein DMG67_07995 [Acidobacteriota bacterium]